MVDDTLYGRRDRGGNLTTKSAGADSPPIYTTYGRMADANKIIADLGLTRTRIDPYPWQQHILFRSYNH